MSNECMSMWQPQDLLDDLQAVIDEEPDIYPNYRRVTLCEARDYLKDFFSKGMVEVVRCKDCKYYRWDEWDGGVACYRHGRYPLPGDFCSNGEREDNGENESK